MILKVNTYLFLCFHIPQYYKFPERSEPNLKNAGIGSRHPLDGREIAGISQEFHSALNGTGEVVKILCQTQHVYLMSAYSLLKMFFSQTNTF
jgi:hypothetical protein